MPLKSFYHLFVREWNITSIRSSGWIQLFTTIYLKLRDPFISLLKCYSTYHLEYPNILSPCAIIYKLEDSLFLISIHLCIQQKFRAHTMARKKFLALSLVFNTYSFSHYKKIQEGQKSYSFWLLI